MFVYLVTFAGLVQNLFSTTFLPMVVKVKCYGKFTNATCVERRHFYQHTPYCRTLFIAGLFQAMAGGGVKRHELTDFHSTLSHFLEFNSSRTCTACTMQWFCLVFRGAPTSQDVPHNVLTYPLYIFTYAGPIGPSSSRRVLSYCQCPSVSQHQTITDSVSGLTRQHSLVTTRHNV